MRKFFLLLSILTVLCAQAAEHLVKLDTLSGSYFTIQNNYVLTGTLRNPVFIRVANNVTFTLRNATIEGIDNDDYLYAGITCFGNAIMILEGTNYVRGFEGHWPGIHVYLGTTLRITGEGKLTAATSRYGAGIGAGASWHTNDGWGFLDKDYELHCGNIIIEGGDIWAIGGWQSPGIGAPPNSYHEAITITSGVKQVKVTKGDESDVFIGGHGHIIEANHDVYVGGKQFDEDGLTGPVSERIYTYVPWTGNLATLTGDEEVKDGSTIRGTLEGRTKPYKISIPDGARIKLNAAKIKGYPNNTNNWAGLTCNGDATIELVGDYLNYVEGFGSGYPGIYVPEGKTLTITGEGNIKAVGAENGAGIGGGSAVDCGNIILKGGYITAEAPCDYAAAIGGGLNKACGDITIENTVEGVSAKICNSAPCAIGRGYNGTRGTLKIGGTTYAPLACIEGPTYTYEGEESLPECPKPTNLTVSRITPTSALIAWDAESRDRSFEIRYMHPLDPGYWYKQTVATSYYLTNLEPNTEYVVWVVAYCGSDSYYSENSQSIRFFTDPEVPVEPVDPNEALDDVTTIAPGKKLLRNGQLFIEINGHRYNTLGTEVK